MLMSMDTQGKRHRKAMVECAYFLEKLGLKAGLLYGVHELNEDVENYEIEWLNHDLLIDLMKIKGLPHDASPQLRRFIDDHAFGLGPRDVTEYHRLLTLYVDGYEVTSGMVDLDAAEAELAKKTR